MVCFGHFSHLVPFTNIFLLCYGHLGVLMWEVFTCGKMPYGRLKNTEVVERVQRGIILEKPKSCAKEIYDVSTKFICFNRLGKLENGTEVTV